MTNINTTYTEDRPIFDQLPEGYIQIGQVDEMVCDDECGGIYYQRGYTTPDRLCVIERTPCQCMIPKLQSCEREWQINEQRTRQANLSYLSEKFFNGYDLLSDPAYNRMAFDNYKPETATQKQALDSLKEFAAGRQSICLYGAAGRGKTHLALSVARKAKQDGRTVLAVKAIDLLTRLKRTYDRKDDENEVSIMQLLRNIDVLVIDDIGQERTTDWVKSKFYEIIDHRARRRTTIYTTNLSSGETERKEGQALVSRIWGAEICLQLDGRDYRQGRR